MKLEINVLNPQVLFLQFRKFPQFFAYFFSKNLLKMKFHDVGGNLKGQPKLQLIPEL